MNEFVKSLDPALNYLSHEINEHNIIINVESSLQEAACPYCGNTSLRVHSVYQREFQDLPFQDKQTSIILNNKKYFCDNQDCSHRTFAERFNFITPKSRKTNRLIRKILRISTTVSSVSASQILKSDMTIVSKSTICNLLKKMPVPMDKSGIIRICIDDFAFKKRYSYGTIMVDLDSHRIIDILDSRDKEPVIEWLRSYPNIEVVSRDGSQVYASAITEAHPRAAQISDRFHLLKNLSETVEKYMFRLFPARIEIPATAATRTPEMQALLDTRNRAQRIRFARAKYNEGLTVNEIALLMHSSLTTIDKYLAMKEEDIPEDIDSARERQHKVAVYTREQKIAYVRKLFDEGCSLHEISRITGHVFNTIRRYLSEDVPNINGHYDNRRPGKLQPYESEVLELRSKGLTYVEIIKKKGCTGTVAALRVFMQKEREHQKKCETENPELKEYIPRKWMVRLIYRAIDNIKGITQQQYEEIIKKYPTLGKAYELLRNFHELMFSKNVDKLKIWMEEAEKLQIDEVNSYLAGLRKDLVAVKNSIIYSYSNGLAEGMLIS